MKREIYKVQDRAYPNIVKQESMNDNKLIAEFMGYRVFNKDTKCYSPKYDDGTIAPMQFHKSWDWLMPVHKKCMFTPNFSGDDQLRTLLIDAVIDADINRLYDAVVEFIKQYNDER